MHSDLIFYGGNIITLENDEYTKPEAIYVKNGKIIDIGSEIEILKLKNDFTQMIDLKGKSLLPGFIDVHSHPDLTAFFNSFIDLSGFSNRTQTEVWNKLENSISKTKPGNWVLAKGFDPMLVKGLEAPKLEYLDRIAPNNPVFIISQNLHSAWVNSKALKELGINSKTPNPSPNSYYEKDSNGNLTGFISEIEAMKPANEKVKEVLNIKKDVLEVMAEYPKNGITTISSLGLFGDVSKSLILFEHISSESKGIKFWVLEKLGILPNKSRAVRNFVYLTDETKDLLPSSVTNGDDSFRILGVKLWYDGSPYTGSMYVKEPYLESDLMQKGLHIPHHYSGKSTYTIEELTDKIKKYNEAGWQIAIHAQGDRAIEDVLNSFKAVNLSTAHLNGKRHRIEHGLLFPTELMELTQTLGLTVSFHINHLYYYGNALSNDILGLERTQNILPVHSAQNQGITTSLHADLPMYPSRPLSLVQTSVTRKNKEGQSIGQQEAISIKEGLKSVTIYAAWQLNMEKKIGTIKKGKYADLVILSENPLVVNIEKLREIQIEKTFINGEEVYSRK